MIYPSRKAEVFATNVDLLGPMDIGKVITISAVDHEDDEGGTYESSGVLYSILRKFDRDGDFSGVVIRLGGADANIRNRMLFVLDSEEATSGDYKFKLLTSTRH